MQNSQNKKIQVNKYDRQIRLWGQLGQKRLSQSRVALLGTSGAGIQAIKNLVLPGVGHIDIWDDSLVSLKDLSSSFFLTPQNVGLSKSEALIENLIEMNPQDVLGKAYRMPIPELLKDQQKLKQYSLLICSDLSQSLNKQISHLCYGLNIPVIFITVVGFYAYIRNQVALHFVTSSNTSSKKYYMRLHDPFPQLRSHSEHWNILTLVSKLKVCTSQQQKQSIYKELKYIPYPIILLQIYQGLPLQQRSRKFVIEQIRAISMILGEDHRDNFSEAIQRTLDLFQTPDNFLLDIGLFTHPRVLSATAQSPHVLQFLFACGKFYDQSKHLPQQTKLPDMHTSTKTYLELKQIYKSKHEVDALSILKIVQSNFVESKLEVGQISFYIQNLQCLQLMELGQYAKQLESIDNQNLQWENPEWRSIMLAMRAYKIFEQKLSRHPRLSDLEQLKDIAESIKTQYGFEHIDDDRFCRQVCRVEGQTTISMSSIAGAVAGQQAIKLITQCFTPVKNGYLYSGVHSNGFSISL